MKNGFQIIKQSQLKNKQLITDDTFNCCITIQYLYPIMNKWRVALTFL